MYPITPSEVVVLRGPMFAESAGIMNSWNSIGSDQKVKGPELAQKALAAAFLALEQAGDVSLETDKRKSLFGMVKSDTLMVVPSSQPNVWPQGSYEAAALKAAQSTSLRGKNNVKDITYIILQEDYTVPWNKALSLVHDGLAQRGLLEEVKEKKFLVTTVRRTLPASTAALLDSAICGETQALLKDFESQRPEFWKIILKEIKAALDARRESSSDD